MNNDRSDKLGSNLNSLYRIGGVAALICALLYLVTLGFYIPAYRVAPPPATVLEWFTLFRTHPVTGLFFLGFADIFIMILWVPLAIAIFYALGQYGKTWARIALAFVIVGVAVYLATNTAFSMLSLNHKYAIAATETEKNNILAAGQVLVAISEGTGGQYSGMPLVWLAGLILSVIMRRSNVFSKSIAWTGILGLGLLFASMPFAGYATTGPMTAIEKAIVAITYSGGGLLSLVWYILVGLKLMNLGQFKGIINSQQS